MNYPSVGSFSGEAVVLSVDYGLPTVDFYLVGVPVAMTILMSIVPRTLKLYLRVAPQSLPFEEIKCYNIFGI